MRHSKVLPTELYLWQCETCQVVVEYPSQVGRHLKPVEDHTARSPWCMGKQVRVTYRLQTKGDYTLRA